MSNYFKTEFGDKIQMLPEVEQELYPNLLKGPKYFEEQFTNSFDNLLKNETPPRVKIKNGYINNDLYSLGCVLDLLSELKLTNDKQFKKCLDIGGREGIHAAIFRGLYANEVHVADISDGKDPFLTYKILKALYRYIPYYFIDNFVSNKYGLDFLFKKISDKIEKGGLLCTMAPYSWAGRSGLDSGYVIGGEFGYFEQRLTKNDIQRYYNEYKPEVAHLVDWGYNAIDPHRPTIQNYIDEARKHGLVIEGVKRIYDNLRYDLVSNGKIIYKNSSPNPKKKILPKIDIDEVLKNIHQFRTDVKLEDLLTRAAVMVFRKI